MLTHCCPPPPPIQTQILLLCEITLSFCATVSVLSRFVDDFVELEFGKAWRFSPGSMMGCHNPKVQYG